MADLEPLFIYDAPTGIRCCVQAQTQNKAAKIIGTTPITLSRRGKKVLDVSTESKTDRAGLKLAAENPGTIVILQNGAWTLLTESPEKVLMSDYQRLGKSLKNALIDQEPMSTHTIRTTDESWARFLEIGGSKWFRAAVDEEFKRRHPNGVAAKPTKTAKNR